MAQLNHPHIVRVLDVDRDGDTHFFIMEYIAGRSLSQYLRERGPRPEPEVLALARQVAQALEYAHSHMPPVIHRDIKPANILLEEHSGRVVVTDFGIAKVLGVTEQTRTGQMLGTLRYCAPEQLLQSKALDGRADLYALGLVMYEMAAGQPFFAEADERELLQRVLQGSGENVPTFAGPVSPEFVALVTRAIARKPERRYPRAAELLRDIEACLALPPTTASTALPGDALSASPERGQEREREREQVSPDGQDRAGVVRLRPLSSARRLMLIGGATVGVLVLMLLFLLRGSLSPKVLSPLEKGRESRPLPTGPQTLPLSQDKRQPQAIGVMHFKALSVDPQLAWIQEAIRDNFNSQLGSASGLKVYSKEYIDFLVQKGSSTEIEVANQLGIAKMISGSFLAIANKLRIEAHIVDVQSGLLEVSDQVEGEQSDFFNLHRQLAAKIIARLNVAVPLGEQGAVASAPTTPNLDTYKLLLEAEGETQTAVTPKTDVPHSQGSPQREEEKRARVLLWWGWPKASVAWADDTPQQGVAPEEEVRQVLEKYREAYEKKDLTLLENVYDTLPTAQREANAKYFQYTQSLRVTIRDVDIAIRGNEAAVSYTREDQFIDAQTGRSVKLDTRLTKIFVRTEGTWKIVVGRK